MTDPLTILIAVNSFYTNAFSELLTITIVILGFGGVILPIILQYLQSRSFQNERKSLDSQIAAEINNRKQELKSDLENQFQTEKDELSKYLHEELETLKTIIGKEVAVAKAGVFMLQGRQDLEDKNFADAACDYASAIQFYLLGEDEVNGQRALVGLKDICVPQLNIQNFETVDNLDSS